MRKKKSEDKPIGKMIRVDDFLPPPETAEQFIKRKTEEFEKQEKQDKLISIKDIGRKGKWLFSREKFTFMKQHNYENKVFIIERLRNERAEGLTDSCINKKKGDIEYRICY